MPKESFAKVVKRRLQGVLFIAIVVGLVSLSIMIYNKVFTDRTLVTLKADTTGNQLILDSDVKVRGIIVGSVKAVRSDGKTAIVTLAMDPSKLKEIPKNVTAQILPKTLFGEQYVSLFLPANPERSLRAGDVIPQDRTQGALEAQTVLSDLYPLLTAVRPADLNATLTAIATALQGRGEKFGRVLVNFDKYLKILNPHTAQLVDDLQKLGKVSLEYNNVAPDILASLQNLQTTMKTVVERRAGFDSLLTSGSNTADTLTSFLSDNEQRLISVAGQSNKVYGMLDQYSPGFSCLFKGINNLVGLANQAIYNHSIHLSATLDNSNMGPYRNGQQPRLVTGLGPNCFGLPDHITPTDAKGRFQIPGKFRCVNDGAPLTNDPCGRKPSSSDTRAINSSAENAIVNTLISGELKTTPNKVPGTATILAAPLLRGNQVVVK